MGGLTDEFLKDFAALGVHGAMALIIVLQVALAWKITDLIKKHVIPLWMNHFAHEEKAFDAMSEQHRLARASMRAQTEAIKANTAIVEAHGQLLREIVKNMEVTRDIKHNP